MDPREALELVNAADARIYQLYMSLDVSDPMRNICGQILDTTAYLGEMYSGEIQADEESAHDLGRVS